MYLMMERNIQIPGCFVVLQGIPGDGLLNTIDTAPDFVQDPQPPQQQQAAQQQQQAAQQQQQQAAQQQQQPSTTASRASTAITEIFLGQGIPPSLFLVRPRRSSSYNITSSSSSFPQHSLPAVAAAAAAAVADTDFVLVDDPHQTKNITTTTTTQTSTTITTTQTSTTQTIPADIHHPQQQQQQQQQQLQRAIDLWKEECRITQTRAAREWLEAAHLQQAHSSSRTRTRTTTQQQQKHPHHRNIRECIPILLSSSQQQQQQSLWWIDSSTAQLKVFETLPSPPIPTTTTTTSSSTTTTCTSLPPGTTVVAMALHTFQLLSYHATTTSTSKASTTTEQQQHGTSCWNYLGTCTFWDAQHQHGSSSIPSEHSPQSGKIQYLYMESPVVGYVVFSIDGYSFFTPGLPSSEYFTGKSTTNQPNHDDNMDDDNDTETDRDNYTTTTTTTTVMVNAANDDGWWWWKVTCPEGAVMRQGLDLNTEQICVIPYGTLVQVHSKRISAMGLTRLFVRAHCYDSSSSSSDGSGDGDSPCMGWCSQFYNPMAGIINRGSILQPLPLAVPVWYQVVHPPCVIRTDIELSSPMVVSIHNEGTRIPVLRRHFTEFPIHNCLRRVQFAPQAYASVRLNIESHRYDSTTTTTAPPILQPTGTIDGTFDPAEPGSYHWNIYLKWRDCRYSTDATTLSSSSLSPRIRPATTASASRGDTVVPSTPAAEASESVGDLSSVEEIEDNQQHELSLPSLSSSTGMNHKQQQQQQQQQHQSPRQQQQQCPKLCVCCQEKSPNATLVHGSTGHICCCLECARILQAQNLACPICRLDIDTIILHYYS